MSMFANIFNFTGKNKKGKSKEEVKRARSVQGAIPYRTVYPDGTIETLPNSYTRSYVLEGINFKIAPDEDQVAIFRAYGDLLNTFPSSVQFEIVIQNVAADRRTSLENIRFNLRQDSLNKYRQEMNGILLEKMAEGGRGITQNKLLVVSIKEDDVERAFVSLDNIEKEVRKGIKRISKPGLRVYAKADELPRVLNGLGIAIVSTSNGVVTDKVARKNNTGGEVLAYIW